MIANYRMIGKLRMLNDGFSDMSPAEKKKYIIRQFVADDSSFIIRNKKTNERYYGRLIHLNLDRSSKSVSFSAGMQLGQGACAEQLIFLNYAPADPNIYASHSGAKSIMAFALLEYIQTNRKAINWSEPERVDACIKYLEQIRKDFFIDDKYGLRPNYRLLSESQQDGFPDPELDNTLMVLSDEKTIKKQRDKVMKFYFEKKLAEITGEKQAFALTIDGKYVHEIPEIASCYIDALYYHIVDKQFVDSKTVGVCHICSQEKELAKCVSLKQKYYGTTYKFFFDNAVNSRSYTSFSMCRDCYCQVTTGTQVSATEFNTYLLGLSCIVLPEMDFAAENDTEVINAYNLQTIPRLLKRLDENERISRIHILRKLQNRLNDFSLFFYNKPSHTSQEFIVNGLIRSISLASLIEKSESFAKLSMEHNLPMLFNNDYGLSFEDLRFMILPSQESHPSLSSIDYQTINRDMLSLLSAYLNNQQIRYDLLVKQFVNIFSRKLNHVADKSTYRLNLSAYLMNVLIQHLTNFGQVSYNKEKEEKPMVTRLEDSRLLEYFASNSEVYENNQHAQGLFILGWYISDVEYAQRMKGINRTAIHKLNLRGIPPQKLKTTMAIIDDLRLIWKTYTEQITEAYYRECMNNIENSSLSPEEAVFHILSGRSYRTYVALLESKKKQLENTNQEEQNDKSEL